MRFNMAAFGVHFGSSSACLAVFKDGKTDVVANDLGDRVTPCVVAYTDHEQAVGLAAKQGNIRNAQNTIQCIKKILGRNWDHPVVQEYAKSYPVHVQDNKGEPQFKVEYKEKTTLVSPKQVAVAIYQKMLETASRHGDGDIHDSVLSVPADFEDDQTSAISDAASEAGFNVLRVIKEPVAAAMAYDLGQTDNSLSCNILVFRLGGESSDASIVRLQNGFYRISGSVSSTQLSGSKFTTLLADHLGAEFYRQYKLDIKESRRSINKLRMATDVCKHSLAKLNNALCTVDSLFEGVDFHNNVSRARFESMCGSVVQHCSSLIDSICEKTGVGKEDIQKVILCGGGSNMPLVQKTVTDYLKGAEILCSIPPDEVIAIGSAKQAGILTGIEEKEIKENTEENDVDCLTKAVCVRTCCNGESSLYPVFPTLTPLPSRKHETLNLQGNQTSLQMDLCECEDLQNPSAVSSLAKIVMRDLPESAKVSVTFHLRREGSLHVTCREETTDKTESVTIEVCS